MNGGAIHCREHYQGAMFVGGGFEFCLAHVRFAEPLRQSSGDSQMKTFDDSCLKLKERSELAG